METLVHGARLSVSNLAPVADGPANAFVYVHPCSGDGIPIFEPGAAGGEVLEGWFQRPLGVPLQGRYGSVSPTRVLACTADGSTTLTTDDNGDLIVGMTASGDGVPANAKVASLGGDGFGVTLDKVVSSTGSASYTFCLPAGSAVDVFALWDQASNRTLYRFGPLWVSSVFRGYSVSPLGDGKPFIVGSIEDIGIRRTDLDNFWSFGTKVGSFYCDTLGTVHDDIRHRLLSNLHGNRRPRPLCVTDATPSWPYTLPTWRQANGNAANQFDFFVGWLGDDLGREFEVQGAAASNAANKNAMVGIGVDSTTVNKAQTFGGRVGASVVAPISARLRDTGGWQIGSLSIGYHYVAWLETSEAGGVTTFLGSGTVSPKLKSGMTGLVWG